MLRAYRPPDGSLLSFSGHGENLILVNSNKSVIVARNINIDLFSEQSYNDSFNMMYLFYVFPKITLATRVTINNAKCLDHTW